MSIAVEAVWEKGVLTPKTRLDLPEKTSVKLVVEMPEKRRWVRICARFGLASSPRVSRC